MSWKLLLVSFIGICIVFTTVALGLSHVRNLSAQPEFRDNSDLLHVDASTAPANCRYSSSPLTAGDIPWVATLGAGWYQNFTATSATTPSNGADFYRVIRVSQGKDNNGNYLNTYTTNPPIYSTTFNNLIDNNPGSIWIIGNEADRGPNQGQIEVDQDDTFPQMYARIYHDLYEYIKGRDPSARFMNTSMVQVTPARLAYLDIVWDTYLEEYGEPWPVDIWNMHIYILPEVTPTGQINDIASIPLGVDPALGIRESGGNPAACANPNVYCFAEHDNMTVFNEQVRAMRTWMKERGQQQKPLVMTEFSILYPYEIDPGGCFLQDEYGNCFTPTRVNNYMLNTFNYLENTKDASLGFAADNNRLVQQWLWFSVRYNGVGYVSDLVNDAGTGLTQVGQTFQNQTHNVMAPTRNLMVERVDPVVSQSGLSGTADVVLNVKFRNNGNHAITTPFTVTFRDGGGALIGQTTVNPTVYGCAVHDYTASVTWTNRPPGVHQFTVSLDSGGVISEVSETDNSGSGRVLIDPENVMMPIMNR